MYIEGEANKAPLSLSAGLLVLVLGKWVLGRLVGQCSSPQERLPTLGTVHVIAATILLDPYMAVWTELHKLVVDGPFLKKMKRFPVLALASHSLKGLESELLLAAVGIDAEAVLLREGPTSQGAGVKLPLIPELDECFLKGKTIKLVPSRLID